MLPFSAYDIKEIMLLMTVYAGFPSAINGTNDLKEVLDERKLMV
jgi:4-carboxymuconolactone decarboxylase